MTPYLVDFLLYGELAESREHQREEEKDSPIKDGEGVAKGALYFFRCAYSGSRIGHSPMGRQGLPRPNRADFLGSVVADSEDKMKLGEFSR